jgi:hypothetical protein
MVHVDMLRITNHDMVNVIDGIPFHHQVGRVSPEFSSQWDTSFFPVGVNLRYQ